LGSCGAKAYAHLAGEMLRRDQAIAVFG